MKIIYQRVTQKSNGLLGSPQAEYNGVQGGYDGDIIDISAMENHPGKVAELTQKKYDYPATGEYLSSGNLGCLAPKPRKITAELPASTKKKAAVGGHRPPRLPMVLSRVM